MERRPKELTRNHMLVRVRPVMSRLGSVVSFLAVTLLFVSRLQMHEAFPIAHPLPCDYGGVSSPAIEDL